MRNLSDIIVDITDFILLLRPSRYSWGPWGLSPPPLLSVTSRRAHCDGDSNAHGISKSTFNSQIDY